MKKQLFRHLFETPNEAFQSDNLVTNNKNDFIFKTPKSRGMEPSCSYQDTDTMSLKTCPNLNHKLKKTIAFSTSILDKKKFRSEVTPYKRTINLPLKYLSTGSKSDLSRIVSNKLVRKSKLPTKTSTTLLSTGPSTSTTTNTKRTSDSCLLIAIVEGRGVASGEIGIASVDLKNPELELSQFSDSIGYSRTLSKLYLKDPVEIVFPHTMCENGVRSKLFQIVSEFMHKSSITTIHRRYYNDKNGKEIIQHLCHKDYTSSILYESREKYYALAACAAIIKYVEFIQNILFAPGSLQIIFSGSVKCAIIDIASVRNLELVENSKDLTENGSLFSALNFTTTNGGYRLLRANILQPSFDIPTITSRYDCVEELMNNAELFFTLKSQIKHFVSLNHLLSLCVQLPKNQTVKSAENTITQVIALKHVMELIPTLRATLQSFKSSLFIEYHSLLVDSRYDEILSIINVVVHEDVHFEKGILQMRSQKLFAIKDGINVILDIARRSYSEQIEALRDEVQALSVEHALPLRVAFSNSRGFYIQLPLTNSSVKPRLSLPFIKVAIVKNFITCTTEKIMKFNERLKGALAEIYLTAELLLSELIKAIRVHMGVLYRLSEISATLDLLLSFAQVSKMQNYIRPEFTDTLAIKNCRNPLLDRLSNKETISNHVYAANLSNFTIVTGANMSGKSMYLRQIALVQIMGQIGCFIPAEYASFRLSDHLFTRIGVDDDIQSNSSTFTIEMREMSYIINTITDNSLVLIDELGRGTSFDEGLGICFAICEHLLQTKAFIFIATHFRELSKLEILYPNVQNVNFEVKNLSESDGDENHLLFTYKCVRGVCPDFTNAMKLAKLSNLPKQLLFEAEKIYGRLGDSNELIIEENEKNTNSIASDYEICKLSAKIEYLAKNVTVDTPEVNFCLKSLQNQCRVTFEKLNKQ